MISKRTSGRAATTGAVSAGREALKAEAESRSQAAAVVKYKSKSGISVPFPLRPSSLPIPHARRPDATPLLRREDPARTLAHHRGKRPGDAARGAPGPAR